MLGFSKYLSTGVIQALGTCIHMQVASFALGLLSPISTSNEVNARLWFIIISRSLLAKAQILRKLLSRILKALRHIKICSAFKNTNSLSKNLSF